MLARHARQQQAARKLLDVVAGGQEGFVWGGRGHPVVERFNGPPQFAQAGAVARNCVSASYRGGVGSGLYGMLVFAIVAVFIAGLMVGRTPEYLGKKIGAFEIKMASLVILLPCAMVLLGTACAVMSPPGRETISNPGPHGFSQVLYAFSSTANNNGSAFAGLGANTPFYNGLLGLAMLVGRFWVMLPVLAIAGSMVEKKKIPVGNGTLPTHTPLFVALLVAVVVVVGALSFFPALALGPIVEHLLLGSQRVSL